MEKTTIQINKYADRFLIGNVNFKFASDKAYADMARRTLRIDVGIELRSNLKSEATRVLKECIENLKNMKAISQCSFQSWHKESCNKLIDCYKPYLFYYGQSQKWLNMLLKYLYVYDVEEYQCLFSQKLIEVMDMPIDFKVIKNFHNQYNIKWPNSGWSKWNENTYRSYQESIRKALIQDKTLTEDEKIPFYWELIHWSDLD